MSSQKLPKIRAKCTPYTLLALKLHRTYNITQFSNQLALKMDLQYLTSHRSAKQQFNSY